MELAILGSIFHGKPPIWWVVFHQTPDVPGLLVEGKEKTYKSWLLRVLSFNSAAITEEAIDEYVRHYSVAGGMHAGFEHYGAFPQDAIDNQNYSDPSYDARIGPRRGKYLPVLGVNVNVPSVVYGMNMVAQNIQGIKIPNAGHYIQEE